MTVDGGLDASIVIPYHKRKDLFLNQFASLRASDYPREKFEVILVEDGSDDFTEEDLRGHGIRTKYLRNEKKDPTRHTPPRNKGIGIAEGEIVVFLDCDQIVAPDFIANHVAFHREQGPDVLQIGTRKELKPDQDVGNLAEASYDEDVRIGLFRAFRSDGEGLRAMWANVWSHNISIRREHVLRHGGFDESFIHWGLEDQEFGLRMERAGLRIRFNPSIEVHHQYHKPAWGGRIHKGWRGNFALLLEKYGGDPRVQAVSLIGDVLDPGLAMKVRPHRVRELSLLYFAKMEIVSRCLAGDQDFSDCLSVLPESADDFLMKGMVR